MTDIDPVNGLRGAVHPTRRVEATHPVHDHLSGIATAEIRHDPFCGAHPALDDGPCYCGPGLLGRLVAAIIDKHHPMPSRSINALNCERHHPLTGTQPWRPDNFDHPEACPECVVTPLVTCSCWNCNGYPCPTIDAVVTVLRGSDD